MTDYEPPNAVLDFNLEFVNGLLNGTDPSSLDPQPDYVEAYVQYCDAFTKDGYDPYLEVGSKLEITNGRFIATIEADFKSYSIYLHDFRSPNHPDFSKPELYFQGEIRLENPDHLDVHSHDEKSYAMLTVLQEMFVMLQFGKTFDDGPLIDWELTRTVCQYLQSEFSIHSSCLTNCDLRQLAEKNFQDFEDLNLPLESFFKDGDWSRPPYCPQCSNPVCIRSIVKQPDPELRGKLESFPQLPEVAPDEPTMYCWECGWQEH